MKAFTPGPWHIVKTKYKRETRVEILRQGHSEPVARIYRRGVCNGYHYTMPQDANAQLIAAAPELLEALIALYGTVAGLKRWEETRWPNIMAKARAAMAKATHETKKEV